MQVDKPFKTHEELIELLKNRGIDISTQDDEIYAKNILSKEGYYNIINGYNNEFSPDGLLSRAEAAQIISNMLSKI